MIIKVKVNTNSQKEEVRKTPEIEELDYIVKFKSEREKGKANQKLIQILSDYFNVSQSQIRIVRGHTSTRKVIDIEN